VIILHSLVSPGHPELETYARNVGLEIEKLGLDGVIVRESPAKRSFAKLLKEYEAGWIFDLHSDVTEPYWAKEEEKWVRTLPYSRKSGKYTWRPTDYSDLIRKRYPVAGISYGGNVWDPDAELCMPVRNWVGKLIEDFSAKKYGTIDAIVPSAFYPRRCHERLLGFGLIYARPLHISVDLVKSFAEYLHERF